MRLVASARDSWPRFDGWCATTGVDPLELPVDRFCNLVYFWLAQNRDERQIAALDSELSKPLPGRPQTAGSGVWAPDAEMDAFLAAQAATAG